MSARLGFHNPFKKKDKLFKYTNRGVLDREDIKTTMLHIPISEFEKYKGLGKEELFKALEDKWQTKFEAIEVVGMMVIRKR